MHYINYAKLITLKCIIYCLAFSCIILLKANPPVSMMSLILSPWIKLYKHYNPPIHAEEM